jgi:urease accessory protein
MALLLSLMIMFAPAARAHVENGGAGSLISGLLHPVTGLDHVVAMVAVGLWGAVLAAPAIWQLPVAFPMVMALGGLIGLLGLPLPGVEVGIAISGMVLGLLVASERRVPLAVALALVGVFALFHGYAHGRELPDGANALLFSLAFVAATGLLHLVGILLGELRRWPVGRRLVQLIGAAITISGVWFLLQI